MTVTAVGYVDACRKVVDTLLEAEPDPRRRTELAILLADHLDARAGLSRSPSGHVQLPLRRSGELPAVVDTRPSRRPTGMHKLEDLRALLEADGEQTDGEVDAGLVRGEPVKRGGSDHR